MPGFKLPLKVLRGPGLSILKNDCAATTCTLSLCEPMLQQPASTIPNTRENEHRGKQQSVRLSMRPPNPMSHKALPRHAASATREAQAARAAAPRTRGISQQPASQPSNRRCSAADRGRQPTVAGARGLQRRRLVVCRRSGSGPVARL